MKPAISTQSISLCTKSSTRIPLFICSVFLLAALLLMSSGSFAGTQQSPGTESMRTNLYLLNANDKLILADGVLTEYNNLYHDSVYLEDAYKFTNINENLGLTRYGSVLAVERRPIISIADTLFFKLWKTTRRNYQFEFITTNLYRPGMQAFLQDSYLGTSTPLVMNGTTKVNFSINTNAPSANANRFRIVYQTNYAPSTLPVTFTFIKGSQIDKRISVEWKVENELNIDRYDIERSANGIDFLSVNSMAAIKLNSASNSYSWIDNNPIAGNNFYRVKSVDRDGSKKFSLIAKVSTAKNTSGSITIYPNPIKGNTVNLHFISHPPGIYQLRLINNTGQVVYTGKLSISSSNVSETIYTGKNLVGGLYQLEIKAPDNSINIQKAVVRE